MALKVLVVGTGFGCRIQVPAFRGAGFDVAGLVGSDAARTKDRAAANGVAEAFTDLGEAITAAGADVVAISTPPFTHCELAIEALEAGCHVLCEKPFARDAAEARAMLAAAEKAGKVNMIGNEFRFVPQRATVARVLAEGLIGEPRMVNLTQWAGFIKAWEEDFPDWWFDPAQGGGWLGASGSHAVDQLRAWLGEFDSVSAALARVTLSRGPVDDAYSLRFRMKNGAEGVLQQCSGAWGPMTELTHIAGSEGRIWFDGAAVRFADADGEHVVPIPADLALPSPPPLTGDPRNQRDDWAAMAHVEIAPYTQLCRVMKAAILGQPSPSPVPGATFADGLANMLVMDAIRQSAEAGGELIRVG